MCPESFLAPLNVVYVAGVTVSYQSTTDVLVSGIQIKNMTSNLSVHLYDNFMEKNRMCVHVADGHNFYFFYFFFNQFFF